MWGSLSAGGGGDGRGILELLFAAASSHFSTRVAALDPSTVLVPLSPSLFIPLFLVFLALPVFLLIVLRSFLGLADGVGPIAASTTVATTTTTELSTTTATKLTAVLTTTKAVVAALGRRLDE